jgi:putative DNA primase/helicase
MAEQNPSQADETSGQTNSQSQGNGQPQPQGNGQGTPLLPPPPSSSSQQSGASSGAPPQPPPSTGSASPQGSAQPQPRVVPRIVIRLIEDEMPRVVDEAEAALIVNPQWSIYQRGGLIVRPIKMKLNRSVSLYQLEKMSKPRLADILEQVAQFERYDSKAKAFVAKRCPDIVVERYLARVGSWKLPLLAGIINTPFLRADGTPYERPGYDPASALLFIPDGQTFPAVPTNPTRDDAKKELKYINDTLFAEFPFVDKVDRAVALSGLLTTFDRRCMETAPMHAFTAPAAGTGKGLLIDIIAIVVTGQPAPVISQSKDEAELEKRLGAALIAGDQIIALDNCKHELTGSFLCMMLTQGIIAVRDLGYSRNIATAPNNASLFANGNNLVIGDDIVRRVLRCKLDAKMERPWERSFKCNTLLETARSERGKLVCAILTVLRAWHLAQKVSKLESTGSFEQWSFRVRQPLVWLGYEDPWSGVQSLIANDPRQDELLAVAIEWKRVLGVGTGHKVQAIINSAMTDNDFFSALKPLP